MKTENKRVVLISILIGLVILLSLSSCSTTRHHASGITELNKQYRMNCR